MATIEAPHGSQLDYKIARTAWALLFIVVGALMLVPNVPGAT